jgi:hypothetical protein
MRAIALVLTLAAALLATAASSEQPAMTAGDLQELCGGTDHVSRNACRIYILGVTQGITVGMNIADGKSGGARPCVPEAISGDRLEKTLTTRLDQKLATSPASRDADAAAFIGTALGGAFPCAKPAPQR